MALAVRPRLGANPKSFSLWGFDYLVSSEVALGDYGVVLEGNAVDEDATEAERTRLRDARGPVEPFDFGHAPTGGSA